MNRSSWNSCSKFLFTLNTVLLVFFISLKLIDIYNSPFPGNDNNKNSSATKPSNLAKIIKENCLSLNDKISCYSEKFSNLTKTKDIDLAIQTLLELEKIDATARGCHLIAHKISLTEVEKNPDNWKNLLGKISPLMCTFGFMHGIIEGHERFDPTFNIDKKTVEEICEFISNSANQNVDGSCSHIMGHMLLTQNDGDIPSSVEICEKTSKNLKFECHSGVFMENMTRDNLESHGIAKKIPWNTEFIKNQEKICSEQPEGNASDACWREMSHMYQGIANNDPRQVFDLCQSIPKLSVRDNCYIHSVSNIPLMPDFKPDNLKFLCDPYKSKEDLYVRCFNDAVYFMILSSLDLFDNAASLCNSLIGSSHEACYKQIGSTLSKVTSKDKKNELCSKAPGKFQKFCKGST